MSLAKDTYSRRRWYLLAYLGSLIVGYLYLYYTESREALFISGPQDVHQLSLASITEECYNSTLIHLASQESDPFLFEAGVGRPYVVDLGFAHGLGHKLELQMLTMVAGLRGRGRFLGALWRAEGGSGEHTDMNTAAPLLARLWGGNITHDTAIELKKAVKYSPSKDGSCPRRNAGKRVQGEKGIAGNTLDQVASFLGTGHGLVVICPWFDKSTGGTPSSSEELVVREWLRSRIISEGKGSTLFVGGTDDILIAVHIRRGDLLDRQQHRMTRNHFFAKTVAHILTQLAPDSSAQVVVVSETWREGDHECSRKKKLCNHLGQSVDFEVSLRKQVADLGRDFPGRWRVSVYLDADTARSFLTLVAADLVVLSNSGFSAWAGLLSTGIVLYPADAKAQSVMRRMASEAVSPIPIRLTDAWDQESVAGEWSRYQKCPARHRIRNAVVR